MADSTEPSASIPQAKSYSSDPALYLYTSLTSGSSHIVTATSRLETILKANRVPFKALDIATDEKARMLWGRRAGKDESGRVRKIPGLVQMGLVLGDLVEIEDWNEYGELKQHVKIYYDAYTTPAKGAPTPTPKITPAKKKAPKNATAESSEASSKSENTKPEVEPKGETKDESAAPVGGMPTAFTLAMKQAGEEAAKKAKKAKEDKKKPVEVSDGTGESAAVLAPNPDTAEKSFDPAKVEETIVQKPTAVEKPIPKPIIVPDLSALAIEDRYIPFAAASMQSPNSTAWKVPGREARESPVFNMGSLQSPNSTAWRNTDNFDAFTPADVNPPITQHRGSDVEEASAEQIKAIEKKLAIQEEEEPEETNVKC